MASSSVGKDSGISLGKDIEDKESEDKEEGEADDDDDLSSISDFTDGMFFNV